MKPLIGITASMDLSGKEYTTNKDYTKAIIQMGGIPVVLPYLSNDLDIKSIVGKLDGLYATGGYDIDPTLFNEEPHINLGTIIPERAKFEITLIKETLEANKPILAESSGRQILNNETDGDSNKEIYT